MAITKAEIVKRVLRQVKAPVGRVLNVDDEIQTTLRDISTRGDFLMDASQAITTTAGAQAYALKANTRSVHEMWVDDGATDHNRLTPVGFIDTIDEDTGEPEAYYLDGVNVRFTPIPDTVYIVRYLRSKIHDEDLSDIEFSDEFMDAIVFGTIRELYTGQLSLMPQAQGMTALWSTKYEAALRRRLNQQPRNPAFTKYRDL